MLAVFDLAHESEPCHQSRSRFVMLDRDTERFRESRDVGLFILRVSSVGGGACKGRLQGGDCGRLVQSLRLDVAHAERL